MAKKTTRKRRPGGGRKPGGDAGSALSIRISADTRGALEAEAANAGQYISRLAETLLGEGLKARRYRDIPSAVRALALVIQSAAYLTKSSLDDGTVCEWNTDPSVFEAFRLVTDKLIERLRPVGEIDTSIDGPLIGRSPEQQAEAVFRQIWSGLQSAEAISMKEIIDLNNQRGGRPIPAETVAAMSLGSYTWADVRNALNIATDKGKTK
jgi:hypothetical protein